jgi:Ca2+-binding RTX toxin-like protein
MATFGPDFLVNTTVTGNQAAPSVTALSDGRFVAVWQSDETGDGGTGTCIRMRIYNPDGTPAGEDQVVNTAGGGDQTLPVVAELEDGNIVVAWQSDASDGDGTSVRARMYDAFGTALASEFVVNSVTAGNQTEPSIVALEGGGFVIAFTENASEVGTGLYARQFDEDGDPVGNDFHINQDAQNGDQSQASLVTLDGGGFVAVWRTTEGAEPDGGIKLRTFEADGTAISAAILVNDETTGDQRDPSVTVLANGNFVVSWTSDDAGNTDGDGISVMYRVFESDGDPVDDSAVLSSSTASDQQRPAIAATPDGGFVAVFMDDDGGNQSIRARLFDEDGVALGDDFVVNIGNGSGGLQQLPSVTVLPDGRIVVAWHNENTGFDGNGFAIQAIIFHAEDGEFAGVTVGATSNGDDLTGSDGDDILNGGAGGDDLVGGDGDDFLNARGGEDTLDGGTGNDMLDGGAGGDTIDGGDNTEDGDTLTYANNAIGVWAYLNLGVASGGDASYDKISNVENVFGSQFDDTLAGNGFDNKLVGGNGKNTLEGNGGDDTLLGGSGIDTASGGDGDDTIHTLGGADIIDGGAGFDILSYAGSTAGVTLTLGANGAQITASGTNSHGAGDKISNIEAVAGTFFTDSFTGNNLNNIFDGSLGNDILKGADGNDELIGGDGNDSLDGGNGDDLLKPGDGVDTVTGGAGNDTVSYDDGTTAGKAGITVTLGLNGAQTTASGGTAAGDKISLVENVIGTDDTTNGDTITGNNLDNIINGMSGGDTLEGGLGNDTLSYEFSELSVDVNLLADTYSGGHAEDDDASGFENVIGGKADDQITGDGGDNIIEGREGGDVLDGGANGAGGDTVSYRGSNAGVTVLLSGPAAFGGHAAGDTLSNFENIIGSEFGDLLASALLGSKISGLGGNDKIIGSADNIDTLLGGDGDDEIIGATSGDTLDGGSGIDTLSYELGLAESVTVTLVAGQKAITSGGVAAGQNATGFENIVGTQAADKLTGDTGANVIRGGKGADVLDGGSGIDTLSYAASISGETSGVTITLGAANIETTGSGGDAAGDKVKNFENIIGSAYADKLTGNSLNNVIEGGAGGDTLNGGAGIDTLSYESSSAAVTVSLNNVGDATTDGGHATMDDASGFENLIGSTGNDEFLSDHATVATTIDGRGGNDAIAGTDVAALSDKLTGGDGDDKIGGRAGNDTISGDAGDDLLFGDEGADTITGGTGDDIISGGAGGDKMDGGDGIDTLRYGGGGTATINLAANTVSGTLNQATGDTIKNFEFVDASAASGNFNLVGTSGYNELIGGDGSDTIEGGAAGDKLDGGNGTDIVTYANSTAGVVFDFGTGKGSAGDADGDTLLNFEAIIGSKQNDILIAANGIIRLDGNAGDDRIVVSNGVVLLGGANGTGGDTLDFSALGSKITADLSKQGTANATRTGITGGSNNGEIADGYNAAEFENLIGTALNDKLTGNSGNNVIEGGDGDDTLIGGGGKDTVSYLNASAGIAIDISKTTATEQNTGGAGKDKVEGFTNIIGSQFADGNLAGNNSDNRIEGLGGDDYMFGGLGIDTLLGGDGDDNIMGHVGGDIIDGGAGFDYVSYTSGDETVGITIALGKDGAKITASGGHAAGDQISNVEGIIGSAKDDTLTGNNLDNYIDGGDGNDTIQGLGGADTLDGGDGIDTLSYSLSVEAVFVSLNPSAVGGHADGDTITNFENLTGSKFNDGLSGDANANTINGLEGNDTINGRGGADAMDGGAGIDTLTYATSGAGVTVTLNLTAFGPAATGGDAAGDTNKNFENIIGTADVDKLIGNSLNNVIEGGDAGDTLDGGTGIDTVDYSTSDDAIKVYLDGANFATNIAGGHAEGDQIKNFENLIGSEFNDEIGGDGLANVIKGLSGNDIIAGYAGNDTLYGGDADDNLNGVDGADTIFGENDNDTIIGGGGADLLDGGAGTDTLSFLGSAAGVTVDLSKQSTVSGAGVFSGGTAGVGGDAQGDKYANFENITGSSKNDTLTGNGVVNVIIGGNGDDTIDGGDGGDGDILNGGDDIDTLSYASSGAGVTVNIGGNTASGGAAENDTISNFENLTGSAFDDNLTGTGGINRILGGAGNDTLSGGDNNDTLDGGIGNDKIFGGEGNDTLTGGDGNDEIDGQQDDDTITGGKGNDLLNGSDGTDNIDGGDGDDIVIGGDGSDTLKGGAHTAGVGDTLSYAGNGGSVTVTLKGTTLAAAVSGGHANGDVATGFENITGSNANDILTGDTGANIIDGGEGADTLDGGAGIDTLSFVTSGFVNVDLSLGFALTSGGHIDIYKNFENVLGSSDADTITGDKNVNKLDGSGDNDTIFGGDGNDIIIGGTGSDLLETSFDWKFNFDLTKGADNVSGGAGDDSIGGGLGNDTLDGGDNGVLGDTLSYVGFTSVISVVLGAKNVVTSAKAGTETDSIKNFENVIGGFNNDIITGNEDKNILSGDEGDDLLTGNGGDDTLIGDTGDDVMIGGKGADTFLGARIKGADVFDNSVDAFEDSISGIDTVLYGKETGTKAVTVNLASFTATDTFGDTDDLLDIEVVFGSAFNDTLTGSDLVDPGSMTNNEGFGGLKGNDIIDGGADGVDNHDEVRYDRDAEFGGTAGVIVNLVNVLVNGTFNGKAINIAASTAKDGFGTFDTLSNIEGIRGTAQADWFFANDGDQGLLKGLKGADYIQGGGEDFVDYSADGEYGGDGRVLVNLYTLNPLNLQATATTMISVGQGKAIDGFGNIDTIVFVNNIQGTNSVKNGTHALAINDVLMGNDNVNEIRGMGGNDSLIGHKGADILNGGDGAFDEASYIYESNPSIGVVVNLSSVTKLGVASMTATDAYGATDTLVSIEAAAGSAYIDSLFGGFGANRFYGYDGADTIDGTADAGDIDGVTDLDIVEYARDSLLGGFGNITVNLLAGTGKDGFGNTDALIDIEIAVGGRTTADTLIGGNVANKSYEGFAGLGGIDTIDGGDGFDEALYYFDESFGGTGGITANLQLGTIRDGFGATDVVTNLEGVAGTSKTDSFIGKIGESNTFRGLNGADTFNGNDAGLTGADTIDYSTDHLFGATHGIIANLSTVSQTVDATLIGKTGTIAVAGLRVYDSFSGASAVFDIITPSSAKSSIEVVKGTKFNDIFIGVGGNSFDGGDGVDTLIVQGALDATVILGGNLQQTGSDIGSVNNIENVTTGDGADNIQGDSANNVLRGGGGNDTIAGGTGADTIDGGTGTDMVDYSADGPHGVIVNLSSSTITIGNLTAVDFDYNIGDLDVGSGKAYDAGNSNPANAGAVIFDTLTGIEYVTGTGFKDVLVGSDANNRLIGGVGADILTGGAGGDGFHYNLASEGGDTITDFDPNADFIRINQAGFAIAENEDVGQHPEAAAGIEMLHADYFVVGNAATQSGHGQFVYDGNTGELFWDADGSDAGVAELIATLEGAPALTINDILLI